MQSKKLILTIILTALLIIPLISAYNGGYWGSYRSPIDYLENEWVLFGILFIVFFATIFYTLNKTIKNNVAAGAIALGFSLFISLAIARKGFLWGYGQGIDTWVLLIALLIGFAFLIKFAAESFGRPGVIVSVIVIWILLRVIDPNQILPNKLLTSSRFMNFYEFWIIGVVGLIIFIIIALLFSGGGIKAGFRDTRGFYREIRGR